MKHNLGERVEFRANRGADRGGRSMRSSLMDGFGASFEGSLMSDLWGGLGDDLWATLSDILWSNIWDNILARAGRPARFRAILASGLADTP